MYTGFVHISETESSSHHTSKILLWSHGIVYWNVLLLKRFRACGHAFLTRKYLWKKKIELVDAAGLSRHVSIYIINKPYRSQDGISKSLVISIYFSWQGREFDWFFSWDSKCCRDGSHHEAKKLQRNKKMSFHTS